MDQSVPFATAGAFGVALDGALDGIASSGKNVVGRVDSRVPIDQRRGTICVYTRCAMCRLP